MLRELRAAAAVDAFVVFHQLWLLRQQHGCGILPQELGSWFLKCCFLYYDGLGVAEDPVSVRKLC